MSLPRPRVRRRALPPAAVQVFVALGVLIPVQVAAFAYFGLYKGIWRFASLPDIVRIIKAVVAATVISMVILFVLTRGDGIPRSVPVLYALLAILLLGGVGQGSGGFGGAAGERRQ